MNLTRRRFVGAAIAISATASSALFARSEALPRRTPSPLLPQGAPAPAAAKRAEMPPLLREALASLDAHGARVPLRDRLGLVDFSKHSGEPRFELVNLESGVVEESWLVSHGRGSDPANTGLVQRFSNVPDSNASSRGAYLTANAYFGKHGRSRRLIGLDPENDMALERAIVLHGADYVSREMASEQGRVGRSLGCFAVAQEVRDAMLARLGEGRLLYAGKPA